MSRYLVLLIIGCAVSRTCGTGEVTAASPATIREENAKPGANDWQLTRVRLDKSDATRCSLIEGYCSKQSVKAGESIDIFVSTNPPVTFEIEIFRTGYYGGRGPGS